MTYAVQVVGLNGLELERVQVKGFDSAMTLVRDKQASGFRVYIIATGSSIPS
jgi:hypothetical protein